MKKILFTLGILNTFFIFQAVAQSRTPLDLLIVGDSQVGATWSRSYLGNFLPSCLNGNFVIYGRGGTVLGNWLGKGGMDKVETIQRNPLHSHLNLGANEVVPLYKKRIEPMLLEHDPKRVVFEFGGNYIGETINLTKIKTDVRALMKVIADNKIDQENCFFLTPTFEMQVATKRNIPHHNLKGVIIVRDLIKSLIKGSCTHIDGLDVMKESDYFDGKEFLKRIPIAGKPGCSGAASNDNVHVCGEAAKELAERVCERIN